MRCLLLVLLLVPTSAFAQDVLSSPAGPNRLVMGLAGVGASTVTLMAFGTAAPELAAVGLLLSPVAGATAIHLVGRAQGGEDSFGRTLGNAALGTLPAVGLLTVATLVLMGSAWDSDASDPDAALNVVAFAAGTAFLVLPSTYAAMRYRAPGPGVALARTPEGGLVPVVRVAISF
jgi:hypothetical protein